MKHLLILLLFLSCTTEQPIYIEQPKIPNGLMNQKESDMTDRFMAYKHFETSILLYDQAKVKVHQMAVDNVLSHSGYYQDAIDSGASYYGQCVSKGYVSAQSNVNAFMTSELHRDTIINPHYDRIAVACEGSYTVVLVAKWNN